MLKHYETVFIMTPVLSEDQTKEAVSKYKEYLTTNGAKLVHEESWGLKKLAYPIQKKSSGFYHVIQFQAEGNLVSTLEVTYKRDERILRFLTVALDKHAVAWAEKRKNLPAKEKHVVAAAVVA
jgi:small subunit ribosomal protein S6